MTTTLLVMTDGRQEYIKRTIASFDEMVKGTITRRVIHDDSGDYAYLGWLRETYGVDYEIAGCPGHRHGYSGAVQCAWQRLDEHHAKKVGKVITDLGPVDTNRFTFHLEDDFVFNRPVDLDEIAEFLDQKWWLAQMALRRERWGQEAGGFVEDSPSAYIERTDPSGLVLGQDRSEKRVWLEHRLYYTMTPHLYRSRLRSVGWPDGPGGEIHFKDKLIASGLPWNVPGEHVRFGFWGGVEDGANAVTHIGLERRGHGH